MGDRRASSSASWLSEGLQRGQGQCLVDFWCWIREGMAVVVVGCDINGSHSEVRKGAIFNGVGSR